MMDAYVQGAFQDPKTFFIYTSIVVIAFFTITSYESIQHKFIVIAFFLTVLICLYGMSKETLTRQSDIAQMFEENEADVEDKQYAVSQVYPVLKKPAKIRYVHLYPNLMTIINNLDFIEVFDEHAFQKLIVLLESFLRIYFKVLTHKYSAKTHLPLMRDLRIEILNTISEFYFNVPQFSNNVEGNIYEIIDVSLHKIQSITQRCMKIAANQYKALHKDDPEYSTPYPLDTQKAIGTLF